MTRTCGAHLRPVGLSTSAFPTSTIRQYDPLTGDGDTAGGLASVGSYQLIVQALPVDTDDSLIEANSLGVITTTAQIVNSAITTDIDVDVYGFTVKAGQVVDFDIDTTLNGTGGLGSYLRVFNAQGQQLAFNDDGAAPGESVLGFDAYLRYTFPTAGSYYVGVSNFNNVTYNPVTGDGDTAGGRDSIGSYQLIVQAVQAGSETLTVSISPASISENGGTATGTVTRSNADIGQSLVVTLGSSDTSEATVPATATIPANQVSTTFAILAVDDALLDGKQTATITVSAAGFVGGSADIDVTDYETVTVTINPAAISENGGTATGTVSRSNTNISSSLVVTLSSSDTSEASVPTLIVIPANQASTTFTVTAVDDTLLDNTQTVTISASANGYVDSSTIIEVSDFETLAVTISPGTISENGRDSDGNRDEKQHEYRLGTDRHALQQRYERSDRSIGGHDSRRQGNGDVHGNGGRRRAARRDAERDHHRHFVRLCRRQRHRGCDGC